MKRNELMAIIATCMMLFAVCLSASAKNRKTMERGMTKQEVVNRHHRHCLDDASFSILYNKVKKASFDDNKFDLIEVASLGCNYSCQQVVRMMKIFSFSDERLKVLRMMAPRIVDVQNAVDIYQLFSFDSEKQKVGEILKRCR